MLRICLAFLFVFVWLPCRLFPQQEGEGFLDVFFANIVQMSFWSILAVYLLAALRLYELISLGAIYLIIYLIRLRSLYSSESLKATLANMAQLSFDMLDGAVSLRLSVARYLRQGMEAVRRTLQGVFVSWLSVLQAASFLGIFSYAVYLRFIDAVRHAAPALSDSYVTLAWMKYVERRQLFHDGIYPHGFHIYLSILRKFSAVDPLLVLKYVGPFNGVLITLSVYYVLSRLTRQKTPALVGAFAYGVLGRDLPCEFVRQAATNSQEFALVFLLPTLWFGLRFLQKGNKRDVYLASEGLAVMGLSHVMVAFFAAAGMLAVAGAAILAFSVNWRRLANLTVGSLLSGLVSGAPLAVGLALGKSLHGSSAEFAAATAAIPPPPLTEAILAGLVVALAAGLYGLILVQDRSQRSSLYFVTLLVGGSTALYEAPRFGLQSVALAARAGEFLALALCLGYGLFWRCLDPAPNQVAQWRSSNSRMTALLTVLAIASMAAVLYYRAPTPPEPYKMQWDEEVEQYLRIAHTNLPTDWLIVSNEEDYALVLGRGWHLSVSDFLARYSPTAPVLAIRNQTGKRERLLMSDIFIFYEKEPYPVPLDDPKVQETYRRRLREGKHLRQWVEEYMRTHKNMSLYYQGKHLVVYQIHQEKTKRQLFREVWGEER
ncbi:MAG: hypothetical protein HPY71_03270 [Firmicutes bacterium]|nr:hypothetical protein [Bacillota bacterium]